MRQYIEGTATKPLLLVVALHTGYCGEDNTDLVAVDTGTDIDSLTHEMALEHAQSYDSDGSYECTHCGSSVGDSYCEDCERDCEWIENENVEGSAYLFDFSDTGSLNASWQDIFDSLRSIGVVRVDKESLVVFEDKLEQSTAYTSKDKQELEQAIQEAYPELPFVIMHSSTDVVCAEKLLQESKERLDEKVKITVRVEETTANIYTLRLTRAQYQSLNTERGYWHNKQRLEDLFTNAEDSDVLLIQQDTENLDVTRIYEGQG